MLTILSAGSRFEQHVGAGDQRAESIAIGRLAQIEQVERLPRLYCQKKSERSGSTTS